VLIIIGLLMVAFGPALQRLLAKRRYTGPRRGPSRGAVGLVAAIFVLGM
jgi:hypothetical protein